MDIPTLTDTDRTAALEQAKQARAIRAQVREQLKSGEKTMNDIIEMKNDPIVGRMRVSTLIETLPGYGKAKAAKVMDELNIAQSRRLRGLGVHQTAALLKRFD